MKYKSLIVSTNPPITTLTIPPTIIPPRDIQKLVDYGILEEVREFLEVYTGTRDEEHAGKLLDITGGIPFYLQYLGRTGNLADAEKAVEAFLKEEGNVIFQEEYRHLGETEKIILVAMAKGSDRLSEIARNVELPTTTVSTYLNLLMDKDVVYKKRKGMYGLLDMMFSRWLESRFR